MKQQLNEEFIRMQKLAGIINENQFNNGSEDINNQINTVLATNTNPQLDTYIIPVKFMLEQAFAEDIDIDIIEEEVRLRYI